jgi:hypothetical protein
MSSFLASARLLDFEDAVQVAPQKWADLDARGHERRYSGRSQRAPAVQPAIGITD